MTVDSKLIHDSLYALTAAMSPKREAAVPFF